MNELTISAESPMHAVTRVEITVRYFDTTDATNILKELDMIYELVKARLPLAPPRQLTTITDNVERRLEEVHQAAYTTWHKP